MTPLLLTLLVAACTFGGALLGLWLRRVLPPHHINDESRDIVRISIGLVVTMTALILGLVVSSAKSTFDAEDLAVKQNATDLLALDEALDLYGSETADIRRSVRQSLTDRIARVWPEVGASAPPEDHVRVDSSPEQIFAQILALKPATDPQRWLQSQALQLGSELQQNRWLMTERQGSTAGRPFIIALTSWLVLIFVSFGLFAPRHATGIGTLLTCSLSVAAAIFLILEMEHPYQGLIKVSPEPLLFALSQLGK